MKKATFIVAFFIYRKLYGKVLFWAILKAHNEQLRPYGDPGQEFLITFGEGGRIRVEGKQRADAEDAGRPFAWFDAYQFWEPAMK